MNMKAVLLVVFIGTITFAVADISGDAVLKKQIGKDEASITTTSRVAGAIHSFKFRGQEYIDSFDHGRQLQSASNLNMGKKFIPEVFNPTEAGSEFDGKGQKSSSKLLFLEVKNGELITKNQMAFWIRPGMKSQGNLAYNTSELSNHLLLKQVRFGFMGLEQVLDYRVTFSVPEKEGHTYAQFETLTGYMPWEFQQFLRWNPEQNKLVPLDKQSGEQPFPVALATEDGKHAMGVVSLEKKRKGMTGPGYGRFYFPNDKVVKWNCVYRMQDKNGLQAGDYSFRMLVPFGTVAEVENTIKSILEKVNE
jgi:hypothetical protein